MAVTKIIENGSEILKQGIEKLVPDDLKNRMAYRMEDEKRSTTLSNIQ